MNTHSSSSSFVQTSPELPSRQNLLTKQSVPSTKPNIKTSVESELKQGNCLPIIDKYRCYRLFFHYVASFDLLVCLIPLSSCPLLHFWVLRLVGTVLHRLARRSLSSDTVVRSATKFSKIDSHLTNIGPNWTTAFKSKLYLRRTSKRITIFGQQKKQKQKRENQNSQKFWQNINV